MQQDAIITLGNSLVQHGPLSDRVYLMRLDAADYPGIVPDIQALVREGGYGKIFAKVPEPLTPAFLDAGFTAEAVVPDFFRLSTGGQRENGYFLGLYPTPGSWRENAPERILDVLRVAKVKRFTPRARGHRPEWSVQQMAETDLKDMADLYRGVFASYPFPINDPDYLRETMRTHVTYFGLRDPAGIAAIGSCEMDEGNQVVEMTDFATAPRSRGAGAAFHLLGHMEQHMRDAGFHTAYTIARALSYGINISFSRRGYHYAGTLTRNTQISGAIESMNVWYKTLRHNNQVQGIQAAP